jgi:hypothetical protein
MSTEKGSNAEGDKGIERKVQDGVKRSGVSWAEGYMMGSLES